jgi:hypothetical protein
MAIDSILIMLAGAVCGGLISLYQMRPKKNRKRKPDGKLIQKLRQQGQI